MNAKAVDVPQRRWDSPLTKEMHQCMYPLGIVDVEIPEHGVVGNIGLRMPLVAPVHRGKLDGIANKEHGQIVEDKVLDPLLGVELGRPSPDVADGVAASLFTTYRRDSRENLGLLAHLREKLGIGQIRHVVCDLELAKGPGSFCMDAPTSAALA